MIFIQMSRDKILLDKVQWKVLYISRYLSFRELQYKTTEVFTFVRPNKIDKKKKDERKLMCVRKFIRDSICREPHHISRFLLL